MANKLGFTGKIIYPVITRQDGKIEINYRIGARSIKKEGEDISLGIEAHERQNGSYDVWVRGKLVANAPKFASATETMTGYIDSNTGKLKELEKRV